MEDAPATQDGIAPIRKRPSVQGRFRNVPDIMNADDQRTDAPITHEELVEQLKLGSRVLGCIIETIPDKSDRDPLYLMFLSCNFRPRGYRVFRVRQYDRPRFFRNINRLLALVRNDYFYDGPVQVVVRRDPNEAGGKRSKSRRVPRSMEQTYEPEEQDASDDAQGSREGPR